MSELEQKAFEDLDVIYHLADAGMVSAEIGNTVRAENALREIRDIAESWGGELREDAWENYETKYV